MQQQETVNLEETIIITKKPLKETQQEAQVTPKMTAKDTKQLSSSYDITPRGSDKVNGFFIQQSLILLAEQVDSRKLQHRRPVER